ncbi:YchJ family protein [Microbacterium sp.]|uniref:YchJ family protein n=1 Tax=Microbacterium sp. TaxID=51671 RepID=UPI0039E23A8E
MDDVTGPTGSAFSRGTRRQLADDASCPCGGGRFGDCCGPWLRGADAPSAETLMRSRYSAFALRDRDHLLRTWHPATRPVRLELDDHLVWEGLIVDTLEGGSPGDRRGVVAFRARWRDAADGSRGELVERSRFRSDGVRWWYLDGQSQPPSTA